MAKSTNPKKKSSNALAGTLAAFEDTGTSAAQSMITPETNPVVAAETQPDPTPIETTPTPPEPTPTQPEKPTTLPEPESLPDPTPPPSPDPKALQQYTTWIENLRSSQYLSLNQTLFAELIQQNVIPAPPQALYFGSYEFRLAYLQQALIEATKANSAQIIQTLESVLNRSKS